MKDIALDDLIKEDKEKKVANKKSFLKRPRNNEQRNGPPNRKPIGKYNDKFHPNDRQDRNNRNDRNDIRGRRGGRGRGRFNRRPFDEQRRPVEERRAPVTNVAKSQEPREKGRTLKIMGLHPDFTNQDLNNLFASEGALEKCLIQQDNFGRSLTTAIVRYHSAQSAKNAIKNLNGHKVMNSILTVEPYKNQPRK